MSPTSPTIPISLPDNKAGYTAIPVVCGWAGAKFEVCMAFGQEQYGLRIKNIKKGKCDQSTS